MPALLLDEGLPFRAASALRDRGVDCLHVREIGLASASDPVILNFARSDGRVCVTLDHHFHRLLAESGAIRPSVILIRAQEVRYEETADLLIHVLGQLGTQLETGAAVTATRRGVRARMLPLK